MSDELKPCPFCGGSHFGSGGDDKFVGVWCKDCQATGPNHYGRHEWNTRADTITPPDALIEAALEVAAAEIRKIPTRTERLGGQTFKYVKVSDVYQTIRVLADDPDFIARIIKAAEGRG